MYLFFILRKQINLMGLWAHWFYNNCTVTFVNGWLCVWLWCSFWFLESCSWADYRRCIVFYLELQVYYSCFHSTGVNDHVRNPFSSVAVKMKVWIILERIFYVAFRDEKDLLSHRSIWFSDIQMIINCMLNQWLVHRQVPFQEFFRRFWRGRAGRFLYCVYQFDLPFKFH